MKRKNSAFIADQKEDRKDKGRDESSEKSKKKTVPAAAIIKKSPKKLPWGPKRQNAIKKKVLSAQARKAAIKSRFPGIK